MSLLSQHSSGAVVYQKAIYITQKEEEKLKFPFESRVTQGNKLKFFSYRRDSYIVDICFAIHDHPFSRPIKLTHLIPTPF